MTVGNIEPGQVVEVTLSFIEQAKIFEGAYHINLPRGLVLLMSECSKNTQLTVDIKCSSIISNVFCPKFLKKTDHGSVPDENDRYCISLTLEEGEFNEDQEINIYY